MPGTQPDVGDVHVNQMLTNISIAYRNMDEFYVADTVFPLVPVQKQSDIYLKYNRGFFHADEGDRMVRAPGTRAATTGFTIDKTNTYRCANYAIGMEIPDELRANQDVPLNMDRDAAYLLSDLQRIRRERAWAASFMTTSVWTGQSDQTGGSNFTKFSDYGGSTPFTVIRDGLRAVELSNGGRKPNKIVMGSIVWDRIVDHPDFIDRISGGATTGNPALLTPTLFAAMLGIQEVVIGKAIYRSSDEGASVTLARVLDDDFLLLYVPSAPSLLTPAAGYTFYWQPLTGGGIEFVRSGRENRDKYDWFENHSYFDQVATEPLSGAFYADAVD
jgi:hypothetical protein